MSMEISALARRKICGSLIKKAVLLYMADAASDDGTGVWTSKQNMAADLETTRRTVQRVIIELGECGLIFQTGNRKCRNGFTVEYSIDLDALTALKSTRDTPSPVTPRRVTRDTPSPQDATHRRPNRPLTILEQEVKDISSDISKKPKKKRASRLTENWTLPPEWIEVATKLGLPPERVGPEAIKMRDWSLSSPNGVKLNWLATWRSWVRRIVEDGPQMQNNNHQNESMLGAVNRRIKELEDDERNSYGDQTSFGGLPQIVHKR